MKRARAAVGILLFGLSLTARAVIFYGSGDPALNTSAPTGSLAGSGWQWVGSWEGFAGTLIGASYFLTARHVGGSVGDPFNYNGIAYATTAFFDDPSSDLRICRVDGTFPAWAPLYRGHGEVGSRLVVFGYGLSRGAPVTVNSALRGWQWANNTGSTLRWGQNAFASVVNGGAYWGQLLYATFDAPANGGVGANEAHLAVGDSGGPVFINDGTGWQLAGIAAAVDGPFNTTNTGGGFDAALFDVRGLYVQDSSGNWTLITGPSPVPSGFYATQVSVRASWIDSIAPPDSDTPLFSGPQTALFMAAMLTVGLVGIRRSRIRTEARVRA